MRFQRGNEKALWWKILAHLQKQRKARVNVVICDSSTFKYHRHGGGKKGQQSKGRSISDLTTKLHLAITPEFHIIECYLSGGNRADISCADDLTACVSGCYIIEDKGYDSNSSYLFDVK